MHKVNIELVVRTTLVVVTLGNLSPPRTPLLEMGKEISKIRNA